MSLATCARCEQLFSTAAEKDRVERHLDKVFGEAPALCPRCDAFAQMIVFLDDLKKWGQSVDCTGEGSGPLVDLVKRGAELAAKARAL